MRALENSHTPHFGNCLFLLRRKKWFIFFVRQEFKNCGEGNAKLDAGFFMNVVADSSQMRFACMISVAIKPDCFGLCCQSKAGALNQSLVAQE